MRSTAVQTMRRRAVQPYAWGLAYVRLLARPVESVRALRHPDVERAFRAWTRRNRPIAARGTVALVAGGAVLSLRPRLLLVAGSGVAGVVAAERWRTSDRRGRRKGWPPGSRSTTPLAVVSPDHFRRRARKYGPVFSSSFVDEPVACVYGLDRGIDVLRDNTASIRHWEFGYGRRVPGGFFRSMRGAPHKQDRAMLAAGLSARVVDEVATSFPARFGELLEEMAAAPQALGVDPYEPIDEAMRRAMPALFFGLDLDRAQAADWGRLVHEALQEGADAAADRAFDDLTARIRAGLGERVSVLGEILRRQPGARDDEHVLRSLVILSHTTSWDLSGLVNWLLKHMADNPRVLAAVRDAAASGGDTGVGSYVDQVVSETLRMEQSEYLRVAVTDDLRVDGHLVPAGWQLRVLVAESHRDAGVFGDADVYRPERFAERRFTRREYSPFGLDDHNCLGEPVARAVGRAFVTALAAYDVRVAADGPRAFSARFHFRPNPGFRVALTRRP